MTTNKNNYFQLREDLKKFGLDPREWILFAQDARSYIIQNKFDQSFKLQGYTTLQDNDPKWRQLELHSI